MYLNRFLRLAIPKQTPVDMDETVSSSIIDLCSVMMTKYTSTHTQSCYLKMKNIFGLLFKRYPYKMYKKFKKYKNIALDRE